MIHRSSILLVCLLIFSAIQAQRFGLSQNVVEISETMEEYIQENHVEDIELMVHKFCESKIFLDYLLQKGHHINTENLNLKRKDVRVGKDIDIFVKHFSEHQNFTMLMVPVDIYPLAIYDTLLFAVLEVSDAWLKEKYYYHDLEDDSVKAELLASENHDLLTRHMNQQVMDERRQSSAEIEVRLHESYISTNTIQINTHKLEKSEKKAMMESWGLFKKMLSHNLALNVEMNIYIFGYDDMEIVHYTANGNYVYKITPSNIFTRHHFLEE